MSRNTWPIIVGGCHRSGTSLLRRILNAHSRIFCGPEVKFFQDLHGDYVKDPLRHARFIQSARAVHEEDELLEVLGKAYVVLLERAAARAGKPRWADKNPGNVMHLSEWGRLLDQNWLFVHVVRNPLDTLASIKEANFPFAIPLDLDSRIAHYRRYTRAGLDFTKSHPERTLRVRYEELVRSPQTVLEELMRALEEKLEPGQLQFNNAFHHRGLEDPKVEHSAKVHGNSVGSWPNRLSPEEARAVWESTRDLWREIDPDGEPVLDAKNDAMAATHQNQAPNGSAISLADPVSGRSADPSLSAELAGLPGQRAATQPGAARRVRVMAMLAVYNEERFIANCLEHLFAQGVEVYLMDNGSTDQTAAIARRYLGRGLYGIENFPREGVFRSRAIMERKEELAAVLPADWFMHVDADEVHLAPRSGITLAEAFANVEACGCNAVNFQEFTFSPTLEDPDHDHPDYQKTLRWYYAFTPWFPHRLNAWKRQPQRVDLSSSAGHMVKFDGLRMYPEVFVMRHYLFLSMDHAIQKYVRLTYAPEEVAAGWYGGRAFLKAESIRLPRQAELHFYQSDEQLGAACPRTEHPLFDQIGHWIRQLADENPTVRHEAAQSLGKLGRRAMPAVQTLVLTLSDPNPEVQCAAAVALGTLGARRPAAIPHWVKFLENESEELRSAGQQGLSGMGAGAKPAVPALIRLLKHSSILTRQVAAEVLGKIGPSAMQAVPALLEAKREAGPIQSVVIDALQSIDPEAAPRASSP